MKPYFFLIFLWAFCSPALGFEYQALNIQDSDDIEDLFLSGEIDQDIRDRLLDLLHNPININFANAEDLYELPGITWYMAEQIVRLRRLSGPINRNALQQLPFMNASLMAQIMPFISFQRPPMGISTSKKTRPRQEFTFSPLYSGDIPTQSYLRWRYKSSNHHAGVLMTHRQLSQVQFNPGSGYLISNGPDNFYNIDAIYYADKHPNLTWVLGHFKAGFGHGLVFNNSPRRLAKGLSVQFPVYQDQTSGRIHQSRHLFGSGLSLSKDLWGNRLTGTFFLSNQTHDVYQYDVRYGPDSTLQALLGDCDTPGSSRFNFICEDGNWYSTYIGDTQNQAIQFTTIRDAFDETLAGSHLRYEWENHELGFSHYQSRIRFNYSAPNIHFAPASVYPQRENLHTSGIYYRWQRQDRQWSAEIARSQNDGWGAYGEWIRSHEKNELQVSYRYYHARYSNPHNKAPAAADEFLGLRQSNEEGLRFLATRQWSEWRLTQRMDLWRRPYAEIIDRLIKDPSPPNLQLYSGGVYQFNQWDSLALALELRNKDVTNNGRSHAYEGGDEQGERRKFELSWRSTRFHPYQIDTRYRSIWQDISSRHSWHHEYQLVLKLGIRLKHGIFSLYHAYLHDPVLREDAEELKLRSYINFETRSNKLLQFKTRIGYLAPQDRWVLLAIFKLSL